MSLTCCRCQPLLTIVGMTTRSLHRFDTHVLVQSKVAPSIVMYNAKFCSFATVEGRSIVLYDAATGKMLKEHYHVRQPPFVE